MLSLLHHPLCPRSRYVRLILGEYGIEVRLVEERSWERREEFLLVNPAGETPVLITDGVPAVPGASIIAEYIEETEGAARGINSLLPKEPRERVEVRRLADWYNDKFYEEVSGPVVLRAARHNIRYHLAYLGWLARSRDWLAGERLTLADLAAAAHLSVADYLGEVPWNEDDAAKHWYARLKSRPAFRPILADTLAGLPPSKNYADLDF
jgi:glutathione S-transferase